MPHLTTADGTRLHYELAGSGPLLLCHAGGPGRASAYLGSLGGLSDTRTLVLLDSRGIGRSQHPADGVSYGYEHLAADVLALADELGEDRFDLLCHSAGAIVGQQVVATAPGRVDLLVLVTPSAAVQSRDYPDVEEIRASRSGEPWYAEAQAAAELLAEGVTGLEAGRLHEEVAPFYFGAWGPRQQEHQSHAQGQLSRRAEAGFRGQGLDRERITAALATQQALVVLGALDGMTGIVAGRRVAESFDTATVEVIEGAGHYPWVDEPETFSSLVEGFLSRAR